MKGVATSSSPRSNDARMPSWKTCALSRYMPSSRSSSRTSTRSETTRCSVAFARPVRRPSSASVTPESSARKANSTVTTLPSTVPRSTAGAPVTAPPLAPLPRAVDRSALGDPSNDLADGTAIGHGVERPGYVGEGDRVDHGRQRPVPDAIEQLRVHPVYVLPACPRVERPPGQPDQRDVPGHQARRGHRGGTAGAPDRHECSLEREGV